MDHQQHLHSGSRWEPWPDGSTPAAVTAPTTTASPERRRRVIPALLASVLALGCGDRHGPGGRGPDVDDDGQPS